MARRSVRALLGIGAVAGALITARPAVAQLPGTIPGTGSDLIFSNLRSSSSYSTPEPHVFWFFDVFVHCTTTPCDRQLFAANQPTTPGYRQPLANGNNLFFDITVSDTRGHQCFGATPAGRQFHCGDSFFDVFIEIEIVPLSLTGSYQLTGKVIGKTHDCSLNPQCGEDFHGDF